MKSEYKNNINQLSPVPAPEDLGTLSPSHDEAILGLGSYIVLIIYLIEDINTLHEIMVFIAIGIVFLFNFSKHGKPNYEVKYGLICADFGTMRVEEVLSYNIIKTNGRNARTYLKFISFDFKVIQFPLEDISRKDRKRLLHWTESHFSSDSQWVIQNLNQYIEKYPERKKDLGL